MSSSISTTRSVAALACLTILVGGSDGAHGQDAPRARDLGVRIGGEPGPYDAITDVEGVEVGHSTIVEGEGPLMVGHGPARTGVTAIFPRGRTAGDTVFAAWFTLNGNGEMTGTTWLEDSGILEGPVLITNTHSVGVVRDAVIEWMLHNRNEFRFALPLVAETADLGLNDMNGFHVTKEHVFAAMDGARSGPVREGGVGGGTGMVCHQFKGGIGTASRVLSGAAGGYTVGVLVQCNYGSRRRLRIDGVPVGEEIADLLPCIGPPAGEPRPAAAPGLPNCDSGGAGAGSEQILDGDMGSIIIVVATDAPLLPHQLRRVVRKASLGVGRMGGLGENSSGDIFVAFSTANRGIGETQDLVDLDMLPNDRMNPIYEATVQATEEAIINALVAAETMVGRDYVTVYELPHDRLRDVLREYGRLAPDGR